MKRSLVIVTLLLLTMFCGSVIALGGPKPESPKGPEKQVESTKPAAFAEKVFQYLRWRWLYLRYGLY